MPAFTVSRRAKDDIKEIGSFTIKRWGALQADRYLDGMAALFHIIAGRPMMGRGAAQVRADLRRIEYISHIVFYRVVPRGVSIERVLHKSKALRKQEFKP
jgi:toxin ParE1/3/4